MYQQKKIADSAPSLVLGEIKMPANHDVGRRGGRLSVSNHTVDSTGSLARRRKIPKNLLAKAEQYLAANVVLFSACHKEQKSAGVNHVRKLGLSFVEEETDGGACTSLILQLLYAHHKKGVHKPPLTYGLVLTHIEEVCERNKYNQVPHLSSSRPLRIEKDPFQIVPLSRTGAPFRGTKRALLVGIQYKNSPFTLSGCHNDCRNVKKFLEQVHGFEANNITMMLDDGFCERPPTKSNLLREFFSFAMQCKEGDAAVFHFSGHGLSVKDQSGDEREGFDQALMPMDYLTSGEIIDDEIFRLLLIPMPKGVTLTAIVDCCHSGSVFDLPFEYTIHERDCDYNQVRFPHMQMAKDFRSKIEEMKNEKNGTTLFRTNHTPIQKHPPRGRQAANVEQQKRKSRSLDPSARLGSIEEDDNPDASASEPIREVKRNVKQKSKPSPRLGNKKTATDPTTTRKKIMKSNSLPAGLPARPKKKSAANTADNSSTTSKANSKNTPYPAVESIGELGSAGPTEKGTLYSVARSPPCLSEKNESQVKKKIPVKHLPPTNASIPLTKTTKSAVHPNKHAPGATRTPLKKAFSLPLQSSGTREVVKKKDSKLHMSKSRTSASPVATAKSIGTAKTACSVPVPGSAGPASLIKKNDTNNKAGKVGPSSKTPSAPTTIVESDVPPKPSAVPKQKVSTTNSTVDHSDELEVKPNEARKIRNGGTKKGVQSASIPSPGIKTNKNKIAHAEVPMPDIGGRGRTLAQEKPLPWKQQVGPADGRSRSRTNTGHASPPRERPTSPLERPLNLTPTSRARAFRRSNSSPKRGRHATLGIRDLTPPPPPRVITARASDVSPMGNELSPLQHSLAKQFHMQQQQQQQHHEEIVSIRRRIARKPSLERNRPSSSVNKFRGGRSLSPQKLGGKTPHIPASLPL